MIFNFYVFLGLVIFIGSLVLCKSREELLETIKETVISSATPQVATLGEISELLTEISEPHCQLSTESSVNE